MHQDGRSRPPWPARVHRTGPWALVAVLALGTAFAQAPPPGGGPPAGGGQRRTGGQRGPDTRGRQRSGQGDGGLRVVPTNPPAQPPAGGGQPAQAPPGGVQPAGPAQPGSAAQNLPQIPQGGSVTMDFRGSDIGNVLKFFAMATGWQIVPDPGLSGPVTIISPRPLTIDQAFQVLQSTLEVRGFSGQIERRGQTTILKIVPLDRAVQSTPLVRQGTDAPNPAEIHGQVITQVIPVDNVDAATLAKELAPLINKGASMVGTQGTNALVVTDTASNVDRIAELVKILDQEASNTDIRRFPLRYSDANDVAEVLNDLFRQVYTRGRGQPAPPGQPGQPPPPQPQPAGRGGRRGAATPPGQERGAIVAIADTRTNSVLVAASRQNMERVEEIIKDLDDPEATALSTEIIKMKFADAAEVSDIVNTILSDRVGPSSQDNRAASFRQRVFGGGGRNRFGGGDQQAGGVTSEDPFGKVVADPRTNSLIATATAERMLQIKELITQLDVQVPVETTTFVVPLRNAQANDVAYILGQAFGTGTSNQNPFGGGFSFNPFGVQQRNTQRQRVQRRQGTSSSNRAAPRGRAAPVGPIGSAAGAADAVHGTLTPAGFVPDAGQDGDSERTRQFFFGGQFGRQGQMQTPQYGRGTRGNYVNLLQLRENVGVVAEPGSNSLVITTTPDNMDALRDIISQIDVAPQQVMIEVIIAEATLDSTRKLGFQFDAHGIGRIFGTQIQTSGSSNFPIGTAGSTSANIGSPAQPGGQLGVQSANFNALIQALTSDQNVRILSTPKVFTSNNQQATIDIVTRVPYVTSSFTGALTVGNSVTYDFLDVGVTLDVTPRIAEGLVTIDVYATASELLGFDTLQSSVDTNGRTTNILAPRTSERTTDTSVSAHDGEIVALGGLMRDTRSITVNKVPLLGDIPLIGHLFRSSTTATTKTELMIFMIPHVVAGDATSSKRMTDESSARIRKLMPDLQKQYPEVKPGPPPGEGTEGGVAPPAEPGKTAPPTEPGKTAPPAEPGKTAPPAEPGKTAPPAEPHRTNPPYDPDRIAPPTRAR
ncbi:MAG: hypothetical protein IT208_05960 [Chthonomonadales bacterium]|nr:hypothetical protein [Chthonomonadales bacterium]